MGRGTTMSRQVIQVPHDRRTPDQVRPDQESLELACCGGCQSAESTDLTEILTTIVTTRLREDPGGPPRVGSHLVK
jgi:hypothetical protein